MRDWHTQLQAVKEVLVTQEESFPRELTQEELEYVQGEAIGADFVALEDAGMSLQRDQRGNVFVLALERSGIRVTDWGIGLCSLAGAMTWIYDYHEIKRPLLYEASDGLRVQLIGPSHRCFLSDGWDSDRIDKIIEGAYD